jgi:hypothetical protein
MKRNRIVYSSLYLALLATILGCGGGGASESSDPWSFVIFGDTRGDMDPTKNPPYDASTATGVSLVLPQIAAKIADLHPDFVLHVGDLVAGDLYDDTIAMGAQDVVPIPFRQQFEAFKDAMSPVYAANIPVYTVRGNHEVSCSDGADGNPKPELAAAYYEAFGQHMPHNYDGSFPDQKGLTYSFRHKQVTVVGLDQYAVYVAPEPPPAPTWHPTNTYGTNFWGYHTIDQEWVNKELRASDAPFKIVFAHEPAFVATGIPQAPAYAYPQYSWDPQLYFGPLDQFDGLARRQSFIDMLGANGAELFAVGHVHNMSIGSVTDSAGHTIHQLVAGNGGAFPLNSEVLSNEPALENVHSELTKVGFTLVTVSPEANTMLMEYYVMNADSSWSKESFTTQISGS